MLAMKGSKTFVERDDKALMVTSERNEVRIGYLSVPDHANQMRRLVGDRVGPERMPVLSLNSLENST